MIKISNMNKIIKNKPVLQNINLDIGRGQICGFVGPNGCGKTMLFRAICNFINISSGEIFINDKKIGPNLEYPVRLGAIIEYPGFIESYSGLKNLEYLASINNYISEDDILKTLDKVGLTKDKDTAVKKYSLGMKQKLGIAQAIMEDQDLIILDEPINALDDDSVKVFRNIIMELKEKGKTILISSHNQKVLEDLFDIVVKMNAGQIVEVEKR